MPPLSKLSKGCLAVAMCQPVWGTPQAAVINVDSDCSLVEAILTANNGSLQPGCELGSAAGEDTIVLNSGSTHTLVQGFGGGQTGTPNISSKINIVANGSGAVIERDSNQDFRLFVCSVGGDLSLDNVTLRNGNLASGNGAAVYVAEAASLTLTNGSIISNKTVGVGGGIYSKGNVQLNNSTVSFNTTNSQGGGIRAEGGRVRLEQSTVSSNTGGGIWISGGTSLRLANSTIHNNQSGSGTSGVYVRQSTIITLNSTISSNRGGTVAGGLSIFNGSAKLYNSTVANNKACVTCTIAPPGGISVRNNTQFSLINSMVSESAGADCFRSGGGLFFVNTGIIGDGTCSSLALSGDTRLGPLRNNGGATLTHSIDDSSIAFNAGYNGTCQSVDQTGKKRVRSEADPCDIGSVEGSASGSFVIPAKNGSTIIIDL